MTKENDDLHDDSVEMTAELLRLAEEEEARQAAAAREDDDDDEYASDDDDEDALDDGDGAHSGEEDDSDDSDDAEEEGSDDDDEPPVRRKADGEGKGKKQTRAQKRIEELAKKRRKAEQEAFDAEMRALALEKRLEALEQAKPAEKPATTPRPNPQDFEYGEVDPKYVDAMVEHKLSVERSKFQETQEADQAKAKAARDAEHYKTRLAVISEEGGKKFKDYDEIVNSTNFPGDVARGILDSEQGVDISYYLAKNITALRKLTLMSPVERAKEMGRLEERFSARASAGKKRSKAPETPGERSKTRKKPDETLYGPPDQDEFDKVFFS